MSRTRLIKPAFFKHYDLYAAERESRLPLRIAFAGLWTVTDRAGRFRWKADIKPDILPYDSCDVLDVLAALQRYGFVHRYEVDGKAYGLIPSFSDHQTFHKTERPSELPSPVSSPITNGAISVRDEKPPARSTAVTVAVAVAGTVAITEEEEAAPIIDPVSELIAEHDFGPFVASIEGICRSARHPASVMATLRMHMAGEMGHEHGTPLQVGLAAQQFLAAGGDFSPRYFGGFVKGTKRSVERAETRKRNSAEERHVAAEHTKREQDAQDEARTTAKLRSLEESDPDRFAELRTKAEKLVPASVTFGRPEIVRAQLLALLGASAA